MSTTSLVLKVSYNNDIRRWKLDPSTSYTNQYKLLHNYVADSFNLNNFEFKYIDDEGDKISLSNGTDLEIAVDVARKMNASLKVYVNVPELDLELPTKTASQNQNQKISLRIDSTNANNTAQDYSKGSHFDWEEAELLGFEEEETFRLELAFDKENLPSYEVCQHLLAMFGLFIIPFFVTLPFFWCLKRSYKLKTNLSKTVITNKRLIQKTVEHDICVYCCDCTIEQRISRWTIPWNKLKVTDIKVSEGCCDKCFNIKTLKIHNCYEDRPDWVNIIGLKDPDGIRKLLFRLRDENKQQIRNVEEKPKKSAVSTVSNYNAKPKPKPETSNYNVQVDQQIVKNQINLNKRHKYEYEHENEYENEYQNEYENEYENEEPEPEPEPEINHDGGEYNYDMNQDMGAYNMGGMVIDAPVFEFGAYM